MPTWDVRFDLPLDLSDLSLLGDLAQAEALAAITRQLRVSPYVRERIDRLNVLRAIHGTTAIEGMPLSEDEVAQVLASAPPIAAGERERREVLNADRTLRFVAQSLSDDPGLDLSESLVCRINELLTAGIDYPNHTP